MRIGNIKKCFQGRSLTVAALLAMGVVGVMAGRIVEFNPTSAAVTNRVVRYETSADTLLWIGRSNVLINPEVPANSGFDAWKVVMTAEATNVVELTSPELSAIAATNAAAADVALRVEAKAPMTELNPPALVLRAAVSVLVDENNILRSKIEFILAELNKAKANITSWRNEGAFVTNMTARTLSQAKTAIENKIDAGSVD